MTKQEKEDGQRGEREKVAITEVLGASLRSRSRGRISIKKQRNPSDGNLCLYKSSHCNNPRALKRNGSLHTLCEQQYVGSRNKGRFRINFPYDSRLRQNQVQKKSDEKRREIISHKRKAHRRRQQQWEQESSHIDLHILDPSDGEELLSISEILSIPDAQDTFVSLLANDGHET